MKKKNGMTGIWSESCRCVEKKDCQSTIFVGLASAICICCIQVNAEYSLKVGFMSMELPS